MKRKISAEFAYVLGLVFIAMGVVLMEKADFGVSMVVAPAYLIYRWLSPVYSFVTFGMAEYCLQAVLLVIMCLLIRRFRMSYLFSFVTAVIYGFVLDGFMMAGTRLRLTQCGSMCCITSQACCSAPPESHSCSTHTYRRKCTSSS